MAVASPAVSQSIEVGGGIQLPEDGAIDVSDATGFIGVTEITLPTPGETYTGFLFEAGYTSSLVWGLWSTNRLELKRVVTGADIQVASGGPIGGTAFDFDMRIVAGYRITDALTAYGRFFQDQTPYWFGVTWKFFIEPERRLNRP
jgi:hypothetical protein